MKKKRIGIVGAMPEEISGVVSLISDKKEIVKGMLLIILEQLMILMLLWYFLVGEKSLLQLR
jgi:hypothetical protein